ncbi:MAG: hypothetical protein ACYCVB_09875 [Bacilli bacterium]
MKNASRGFLLILSLLASVAVVGCGTQAANSSGPVSQPIQSSPKSQATPSSHTVARHKQGSAATPGQQTSKTSTTGKGQQGGGAPGQSGTGSSSNQNPHTTGSNGASGAGAVKKQSVTINVGSIALSPVSVGVTGANDVFVPVSQNIKTILLPTGWTLQSASLGSGGTSLKLVNSADPSEMVSEVIMSSQRNLQAFYSAQPANSVSWLVANQVVRFTVSNPNNPYLQQGIQANISSGGSIGVNVYLPASQLATANRILDSFVGLTPGSGGNGSG